MRWCIVLVILVGCQTSDGPKAIRVTTGKEYPVIVIEGCEYIEYDYGFMDQRVYSLCHKGNCTNPIHQYNAEAKK